MTTPFPLAPIDPNNIKIQLQPNDLNIVKWSMNLRVGSLSSFNGSLCELLALSFLLSSFFVFAIRLQRFFVFFLVILFQTLQQNCIKGKSLCYPTVLPRM